MDPMVEIHTLVSKNISKALNIQPHSIKVIRRNRHLIQGDFQIPITCLQSATAISTDCQSQDDSDCEDENTFPRTSGNKGEPSLQSSMKPDELHSKLMDVRWQSSKDDWFDISNINVSSEKILLYLDRNRTFKHILGKEALWTGEKLGPDQSVIVNCPELYCHGGDKREMTVEQLRVVLLQEHICNILTHNGYRVERVPVAMPLEWADALSIFNVKCGDDNTREDNSRIECLADSKYRLMEGSEGTGASSECTSSGGENMTFDLRQFIIDRNLPHGKSGFDKNIKHVTLPQVNISEQFKHLNEAVRKVKGQPLCLHLVGQSRSFQQQQFHILWQMVHEDEHPPKQFHLIHGGVRGNAVVGAIEATSYLNLRKSEMRKAFLSKYGQNVQGPGWEDTINQLSAAAVRFELLSNSCQSPVKLVLKEPCGGEEGSSSAGEGTVGVFVMYNYARLATLFDNFEKAVKQGIYPPLPPPEEVDFGTLREEEEWSLLFNYLLPYRGLLTSTVVDLGAPSAPLRPSLLTHKVCQYLHDLSRDLSSYYSHVHVLTESRPQLLPVMHARLYLLAGVRRALLDALRLLGIAPLPQL